MKKAYIIPVTELYAVDHSESLLAASLNGKTVINDGGMVSEQDDIIEGDVKSNDFWDNDIW